MWIFRPIEIFFWPLKDFKITLFFGFFGYLGYKSFRTRRFRIFLGHGGFKVRRFQKNNFFVIFRLVSVEDGTKDIVTEVGKISENENVLGREPP